MSAQLTRRAAVVADLVDAVQLGSRAAGDLVQQDQPDLAYTVTRAVAMMVYALESYRERDPELIWR